MKNNKNFEKSIDDRPSNKDRLEGSAVVVNNETESLKIKDDNRKKRVYSIVMQIVMIVLSCLFLVAIFCSFLKSDLNMDIEGVTIENLQIDFFSIYERSTFIILKELIKNKTVFVLIAQILFPVIFMGIGALGVFVFSIISIVQNTISLVKGEDTVHRKGSYLAAIFYFSATLMTIVSMIGLIKGLKFDTFLIVMIIFSFLSILIDLALSISLNYQDTKANANKALSFLGIIIPTFLLYFVLGPLCNLSEEPYTPMTPVLELMLDIMEYEYPFITSGIVYFLNLIIVLYFVITIVRRMSLIKKEKNTIRMIIYTGIDLFLIVFLAVFSVKGYNFAFEEHSFTMAIPMIVSMVIAFVNVVFVAIKPLLVKKN